MFQKLLTCKACSIGASSFDQDLDSWNVSKVVDMQSMFNSASSFDSGISSWNVSNVKNMKNMFSQTTFNTNISNWDVSKVESMQSMFDKNKQFNQDISTWNVSKVENFANMFRSTSSFNQDLTSWNVQSGKNFSCMFCSKPSFNQDLGNWNVSSAIDLSYMFSNAPLFNQDIDSWDVSKVTNMQGMFYSETSGDFNQDLNNWNVSKVKDMSRMFYNQGDFSGDISNWNVQNVNDMSYLFYNAEVFNQDISSWNTSKVKDMSNMFKGALSYNQPLNNWNVEKVTNMSEMFLEASVFNQPLESWYVENLKDMSRMFKDASFFNQNLGVWELNCEVIMTEFDENTIRWSKTKPFKLCVENVQSTSGTYKNGDVLNVQIEFSKRVTVVGSPTLELFFDGLTKEATYTSGTGTKTLTFTYQIALGDLASDLNYTNEKALSLNGGSINSTDTGVTAELDLPTGSLSLGGKYDISLVLNEEDFVSLWNTSSTTQESTNNKTIKLPLEEDGEYDFLISWDPGIIQKVTSHDSENATHTYQESGVKRIAVSGKIKGFTFNGSGDRNKLIKIDNWGSLNLGNNGAYFKGSENLESISGTPNLSKTINLSEMFYGATSFNHNISAWNVSNITSMRSMFENSGFNQPLNSWNTSSVVNMRSMFKNASMFNKDISSWNVSKLTTMESMFELAKAFNQNLSGWNVSCSINLDSFDLNTNSWTLPKPFKLCVENVYSVSKAYEVGDLLEIIVEFNRNVSVNGLPQLELNFNHIQKLASYSTGSGTRNLTFSYEIKLGEDSEDLNYTNQDSLILNGGGLFSTESGRIADPTLPIGSSSLAGKHDVVVRIKESYFTSVWDMTKTSSGSTSSETIKLPLEESGEYNFTISWGDGTIQNVTSWNSPNATHTYDVGSDKIKVITIDGKIEGFRFNNQGDRSKLINITNWGSLKLGNNGSYFYGAENLENILGIVNLTSITNLSKTFKLAAKFNGNVSSWNTSQVIDMSSMFNNASAFNQNLSSWDVSKTKTMESMFEKASSFNQDISKWNTSQVINMVKMFNSASSFNQNLKAWQVCNVTRYTSFDSSATNWLDSSKPNLGHPCIVKVNSTNKNRVHHLSETISIQIEFNRNVSVTGTPRLELELKGVNRHATYANGSNSEILTFNYKVLSGDKSDNLNYSTRNALTLNGGSILERENNNPAILTLPEPSKSLGEIKNIAVFGARLFTSVWNTSKVSQTSSNNKSLILPLYEGGSYNFNVDWGDGTTSWVRKWDSAEAIHTYETSGVKNVSIIGKLEGFRFNNESDKLKLLNISSWGVLELGNKGGYFHGC